MFHAGGHMNRVSDSEALAIHKTMMRGAFAAAAPGLAALVAATTAARSTLYNYLGMGGLGVAALGVIFFCVAYLFARGRWWAGFPGLFCALWAMWAFSAKAVRLLTLYYQHNPIEHFGDIMAPLPVISLQLTLVIIAGSLAWVIFKAIRLSRTMAPQPVNKMVWGALGLWVFVIIWEASKQISN